MATKLMRVPGSAESEKKIQFFLSVSFIGDKSLCIYWSLLWIAALMLSPLEPFRLNNDIQSFLSFAEIAQMQQLGF